MPKQRGAMGLAASAHLSELKVAHGDLRKGEFHLGAKRKPRFMQRARMIGIAGGEAHHAAFEGVAPFQGVHHFFHGDAMGGFRQTESAFGSPHGFQQSVARQVLQHLGEEGRRKSQIGGEIFREIKRPIFRQGREGLKGVSSGNGIEHGGHTPKAQRTTPR